MHHYDIVTVTDLRFPGGSSVSTAEEIRVQHEHGWRSALYHLPSPLLKKARDFHPAIRSAIRDGRCDLLKPHDGRVKARVLLIRHPTVVHSLRSSRPPIEAERIVLVVNHPPESAFARHDYALPDVVDTLTRTFCRRVRIFPIGPLIRAELERCYDGQCRLETDDWNNVFDFERFRAHRPNAVGSVMRVGRHTRPGAEKWPDSAADILAAYPADMDVEIHVLGGATAAENLVGTLPGNWIVREFGAMPPEEFLRGIDVFVYFHHSRWVESFGRSIVEAMAAGLPCILPPRFRALLGDAALYGAPDDVAGLLARLRDPDTYAYFSRSGAAYVRERFSPGLHVERLDALISAE
jgi:glycosyltransferase involved in cell wall biosynthesis